MLASWLWIPITLSAAAAQTLRNTAQRRLTTTLGTLGATLVRFLYGLPFAVLWLCLVGTWTDSTWAPINPSFLAWVALGAVSQILATACLLRAMQERSFALSVAYSKSEILQVAAIGYVFLGDALELSDVLAVVAATLGVLLLSPVDARRPLRALAVGWASRPALFGLASGAGFALAAIGFRGATLQLPQASLALAAAQSLVVALGLQSLLLGGYLFVRCPEVVRAVLQAWRASLPAGFLGAAASVGWFTAFALTTAAQVRTLGVIELLFSYAISRKLFRERLGLLETTGMLLLGAGLILIAMQR